MAEQARLIDAAYEGTCLTCEEPYEHNEQVYWVPKVGCWHKDCPAPTNLARYIKDSVRSQY